MTISDAFDDVSRLFLDTAPVIYFVERNAAYVDLVSAAFRYVDQGIFSAVTPNQPPAEPTLLYEPTMLVEVGENETEEEEWAAWQALSYRTLWELWDNEYDAIYDTL